MPTAIRLRPSDTNSSCNCGRHQVEGFEETDALRFMEYPLRVLAFAAQVRAKLWVRNGFSVTNQLHNYTMPNCRGYVRSALPACYLGTLDVAACRVATSCPLRRLYQQHRCRGWRQPLLAACQWGLTRPLSCSPLLPTPTTRTATTTLIPSPCFENLSHGLSESDPALAATITISSTVLPILCKPCSSTSPQPYICCPFVRF